MKEKFIENGIEYVKCGDYYLPNFELPQNQYEIGEYGIGKTHLYESLKRLALIEPKFDEAANLFVETLDQVFTERENSYTFFVTEKAEEDLPDEIIQRAKVIRF